MANKFHNTPYLRETETTIKGIFSDGGKNCVQLEDNIFYPQGGGQKGDKGILIIDEKEYHVLDTIKDEYSDEGVLLIVSNDLTRDSDKKPVKCKIDWDYREKQMKLHSAVHLHHCLMERVADKKLPYPKTSVIEENGFAFNRYDDKEITLELVEKTNEEFKKIITEGTEIKTYPDTNASKAGFRWWECLGYKIPCGGTHILNSSEIGNIDIQYSSKKGKPTVKFFLK